MKEKILPILKFPHPSLRAKAEMITDIDGELEALSRDMLATMYAASGIGLAANQVGVLKRIIVFDLGQREGRPHPQVLINPEIVEREGKVVGEEACLSVVDLTGDVERSARVRVIGYDLTGKEISIDGEGLLSVCLQHEIDHLDGILFLDHLSPLKRNLYKRRLKKILQKGQTGP